MFSRDASILERVRGGKIVRILTFQFSNVRIGGSYSDSNIQNRCDYASSAPLQPFIVSTTRKRTIGIRSASSKYQWFSSIHSFYLHQKPASTWYQMPRAEYSLLRTSSQPPRSSIVNSPDGSMYRLAACSFRWSVTGRKPYSMNSSCALSL